MIIGISYGIEIQPNVQSLFKKMLLLMHFNQTRKSNPIEKKVYYKSFIAPFSECFNQTFLDIRNRPPRAKPGRC
jgi:hypothetical protein